MRQERGPSSDENFRGVAGRVDVVDDAQDWLQEDGDCGSPLEAVFARFTSLISAQE